MKQCNNIAFVTNFCPHYRVRTFEILASVLPIDFYFYSIGGERYWLPEHKLMTGSFTHCYTAGTRIGRTTVSFDLPKHLLKKKYDVYVKCINGAFVLPLTFLVSRLRKRPFILWTGVWKRLETPLHRVLWPFLRCIYLKSDAIVGYGEHVKRYLIEEGVSADRIFVASHAVHNEYYSREVSDREKRALFNSLDIRERQKIILFLGRLVPEKGLSYLLEAFAMLNRDDTVLVIAGAGPEREPLERLSRKLGVYWKVRFPGYVNPEKSVVLYSVSWVSVLPSVTTKSFKEPWGLTVNEAFNQSVPVISTDAVGAAAGGLLRNGINGFVVPERDTEALAKAMNAILSDEDLHLKMSQNAREDIRAWTNSKMVEAFASAISSVLPRFVQES